jgi:hypothetical protein
MTGGPSPTEYRELLQAALPASTDADTVNPQPRTLFTPDSHRSALDPDVTVVRGARGVGKTVWFKALQDERLRALAADDYQLGRLRWVRPLTGYGTRLDPDCYPGPRTLGQLLDSGIDPYDIWTAVLLRGLGIPGTGDESTWEQRARWVRDHPDEQEAALARADRDAHDGAITRLVLFDALDRLHASRDYANRLITGIFRLALELRTGTRNLRAKVFIRPDMFDSLRLNFPDASKLSANAADLRWSETNLYGLFFQQLGNAAAAGSETGQWREADDGRYVMPRSLMGDRDEQRSAFTRIAGPYMGANHRKGHTYTWLPNHLVDGIGQTSPRSFLQALRTANDETMAKFASHQYALHWDGIRRGVQTASVTRVAEVTEDLPWIETTMRPLAGLQVPIDHETIVERWEETSVTATLQASNDIGDEQRVRTGPRNPGDYDELISELIEVGIITRRSTGRLDLPDVYRIAFGLGRRGGVPRLSG